MPRCAGGEKNILDPSPAKDPVEMPFAFASPAGAIGLVPGTLNVLGTNKLAKGGKLDRVFLN